MTKMNPEVKAKWVAALRGGEYKQTRNFLHDGVGFCCLGVLCDIHAKETGNDWSKEEESWEKFYMGKNNIPPVTVEKWAGFNTVGTFVKIGHRERELFIHNDEGHTFEQIADAIKGQL